MDSTTLAALIERRWTLLKQLIELGERQHAAIEQGHMSELLATLNEKQGPLKELGIVSEQLRSAIGEAPDRRNWSSVEARRRCSEQHEQCEQMLQALLAQEAECESALSVRRDTMEERLARSDGARRAAAGYASSAPSSPGGGRLDLCSD